MKSKLKHLATKKPKPKRPRPSKAAYLRALALVAVVDDTERF